jgi:hypothetical protein
MQALELRYPDALSPVIENYKQVYESKDIVKRQNYLFFLNKPLLILHDIKT